MSTTPALPGSFETLFKGIQQADGAAELLLYLRRMLTDKCQFDPITGKETPGDAHRFATSPLHKEKVHDYLWFIVSQVREAFCRVTAQIKADIKREHVMLPAYAARELDTKSNIWLSQRPGRTVREKLSVSKRILAVRRSFCVDTTENRLLKAFASRMLQALELYLDVLKENAESCMVEMHDACRRWLHSAEAQDINQWEQLSPNNILLQHKDYRKIWDAWIRLNRQDDIIADDAAHFRRNYLCMACWDIVRRLRETHDLKILQIPLQVRYDTFQITLPSHCSLCGWLPENTEDGGYHTPAAEIRFLLQPDCLTMQVAKNNNITLRINQNLTCTMPDGCTREEMCSVADFAEIERACIRALLQALQTDAGETSPVKSVPKPAKNVAETSIGKSSANQGQTGYKFHEVKNTLPPQRVEPRFSGTASLDTSDLQMLIQAQAITNANNIANSGGRSDSAAGKKQDIERPQKTDSVPAQEQPTGKLSWLGRLIKKIGSK